MKYRLRIEHKGNVIEFVDIPAETPNDAGLAARELQLSRRRQGLEGIVPFLVSP